MTLSSVPVIKKTDRDDKPPPPPPRSPEIQKAIDNLSLRLLLQHVSRRTELGFIIPEPSQTIRLRFEAEQTRRALSRILATRDMLRFGEELEILERLCRRYRFERHAKNGQELLLVPLVYGLTIRIAEQEARRNVEIPEYRGTLKRAQQKAQAGMIELSPVPVAIISRPMHSYARPAAPLPARVDERFTSDPTELRNALTPNKASSQLPSKKRRGRPVGSQNKIKRHQVPTRETLPCATIVPTSEARVQKGDITERMLAELRTSARDVAGKQIVTGAIPLLQTRLEIGPELVRTTLEQLCAQGIIAREQGWGSIEIVSSQPAEHVQPIPPPSIEVQQPEEPSINLIAVIQQHDDPSDIQAVMSSLESLSTVSDRRVQHIMQALRELEARRDSLSALIEHVSGSIEARQSEQDATAIIQRTEAGISHTLHACTTTIRKLARALHQGAIKH